MHYFVRISNCFPEAVKIYSNWVKTEFFDAKYFTLFIVFMNDLKLEGQNSK